MFGKIRGLVRNKSHAKYFMPKGKMSNSAFALESGRSCVIVCDSGRWSCFFMSGDSVVVNFSSRGC